MKVEIENEYSVIINRYEVKTYNVGLEGVMDDYREWLNGDTLGSEDALRDDFSEYITDNSDILPDKYGPDEELDEYSRYLKILNWEEIFPQLADLIEIPVEQTFCDKASYGSNFCPTCGKQLK